MYRSKKGPRVVKLLAETSQGAAVKLVNKYAPIKKCQSFFSFSAVITALS
jgi:hypothetical protein